MPVSKYSSTELKTNQQTMFWSHKNKKLHTLPWRHARIKSTVVIKKQTFYTYDDKCSHEVPKHDTPRVMSAKNHRSEPSLYHQLLYVPITIAGALTTYEDTFRVHPNDVHNSTMTTVDCGPQTYTHTHTRSNAAPWFVNGQQLYLREREVRCDYEIGQSASLEALTIRDDRNTQHDRRQQWRRQQHTSWQIVIITATMMVHHDYEKPIILNSVTTMGRGLAKRNRHLSPYARQQRYTLTARCHLPLPCHLGWQSPRVVNAQRLLPENVRRVTTTRLSNNKRVWRLAAVCHRLNVAPRHRCYMQISPVKNAALGHS